MKEHEVRALKKEDLVKLVLKQEHLASSVNTKDVEINKLREELGSEVSKNFVLEKQLKEQKHLAEAVNAKDQEISDLNEKHRDELDKIIATAKEKITLEKDKIIKDLQNDLKGLKDQVVNYESVLNSIAQTERETLDRYKNLLKILEGTIESHGELFQMSEIKFMSHFPKPKENK